MSHDKLQAIPKTMRVGNSLVKVESDTTLVPARSLDALANTIRHEHGLVVKAAESMLEHAVLCGTALIEAKRQVKRGQWQRWVEENTSISIATGYLYMRCAAHVDLLRENGIEGPNAARAFLQQNELYLGDGGAGIGVPDEKIRQIKTLHAQGFSQRQVATLVGVSISSVSNYIHERNKPARRKSNYRSGRRSRNAAVTLTDDLIEGAALKLRELFGPDGEPTEADRDTAAKILRAAFTYDGPIPTEKSEQAA